MSSFVVTFFRIWCACTTTIIEVKIVKMTYTTCVREKEGEEENKKTETKKRKRSKKWRTPPVCERKSV